MAHFAELNEDNIVERVIVVNNEELLIDGIESESKGIEFCQSLFGGIWMQTSYNANFRGNFAGVGYFFDSALNAFLSPKPFNSWVLNDTFQWVPPIPMPDDLSINAWSENQIQWITKPDSGMWYWNTEIEVWEEHSF